MVFPTRTPSSLPQIIADHRIKYSFRRSVFIHPNDMVDPAEPRDINILSNVHVIEELILLPVISETVVIANCYWTKSLPQHFSLEHCHLAAASVLDSVHASAP